MDVMLLDGGIPQSQHATSHGVYHCWILQCRCASVPSHWVITPWSTGQCAFGVSRYPRGSMPREHRSDYHGLVTTPWTSRVRTLVQGGGRSYVRHCHVAPAHAMSLPLPLPSSRPGPFPVHNAAQVDVNADGQARIAFFTAREAVSWAVAVQETLLWTKWPEDMLTIKGFELDCDPSNGLERFCGPRVQIGISSGFPEVHPDFVGGRVNYTGPLLAQCSALLHCARNGEVLIGAPAFAEIHELGARAKSAEFEDGLPPPPLHATSTGPLPLLHDGRPSGEAVRRGC